MNNLMTRRGTGVGQKPLEALLAAMLLAVSAHGLLAQGLPQESAVTVPAQTRIPLVLKNAINSKTAQVGDSIYCQTIYPITVGDRIVIPVGSYVRGTVTQVVRPGRIRGKAKLGLRFDSLTLPDGITCPMRATLSAFPGNGKQGFSRREGKITGGSSKGKDAGRVARATITGAEIGTLAGIGSRSTLRGLGIGSAAGGAAGLIWVLATRGRQVMLRPGTNLELQLTKALVLRKDP